MTWKRWWPIVWPYFDSCMERLRNTMYHCRNRSSKIIYLNKKHLQYEIMLSTTRKSVATLNSNTGSKNLTVLFIKSSHISKGADH